jgi:ribosomal protein L18E
MNNALIGKEVPVSAVRFGENAYHVIERATGKMKARRKEGRFPA